MKRRRTYNPSQLTANELKSSFIARENELAEMLRIVRYQEVGSPCQHMLLNGARGMGKTTLGLRFLQAVRETPELADVWQPVPFDEESYGVTGLDDFWLAALRHLSRETGEDRWRARAEDLTHNELDAKRREGYALASLLDYCNENGKQVILFVENLDQIFKQIADERALHALRSALIERPELLLLGSANAVFDELQTYDAAFYEFFRIMKLEGLDSESCRAVIQQSVAPENGAAILKVLAENGRIETIRKLTGGNPRLIVLASEILVQSPLGTAFEDLEVLIDEQTPYFKALIESLPTQARKVFGYLSSEWTPLRARDVSDGVNLSASHTSAQLRQLISKGYVRELQLPNESRARYEVADRFYNIYYLLRCSAVGRKRLSRYVAMIQNLFWESEMNKKYNEVLEKLRLQTMSSAGFANWLEDLRDLDSEVREFASVEEWFHFAGQDSISELDPNRKTLNPELKRTPNAHGWRLLKQAQSLLKESRFDKALEEFTDIGTLLDLSDYIRLHLLGRMQEFCGTTYWDQAIQNLEKAASLAPKDDYGRKVACDALMAIARMRLLNEDTVAAYDSARSFVKRTNKRDLETLRCKRAKLLRQLGEGLWESGDERRALWLWSLVDDLHMIHDEKEMRLEVARVLWHKVWSLFKQGRYEECYAAFVKLEESVHAPDDVASLSLWLSGLALAGSCHWELGRREKALEDWQQVMDMLPSGSPKDTEELVVSGLTLACLKQLELADRDPEPLIDFQQTARDIVRIAQDASEPLQLLALILTYCGQWEEASAKLRVAITKLDDPAEAANAIVLETLLRLGAAGYVRQVHNLMADTRLYKNMEPLWYAVRAKLGESIEPLPLEIRKTVMEIGRRLSPQ